MGRRSGSYKFEKRRKEIKKQKKRLEKMERRQNKENGDDDEAPLEVSDPLDPASDQSVPEPAHLEDR